MRIYLETGLFFGFMAECPTRGHIDETEPGDDEVAAAWDEIGDEVSAAFNSEHPGRRCWGWWRFVAKEPRRRIKPHSSGRWYRNPAGFGVPANCDRDDFETEADYLRRLELLTKSERQSLGMGA